jgi:phosphatidylserine/phosphatidylglycerophosphate/cardiolipin synthase-like enzyme
LEAFAKAHERGAEVHILHDCKRFKKGDKKGQPYWPGSENLDAIAQAGIEDLTEERSTAASLSHNKFIVLERDGKPMEVWTGSTNVSEGGIFGQSNVGHLVRDPTVARAYKQYWLELHENPQAKALREWNDAHFPADLDGPALQPIFSPRGSLEALENYGELMKAAHESAFLTAAFGINDVFEKVMTKRPKCLRYALLESEGDNYTLFNREPSNRLAVGNRVPDGGFGEWVNEIRSPLNNHVYYIHTKYLLIDPLRDEPMVVTGSANFSDASTTKNDENMLIIRGDQRVADIYLGEFMRLFTHYRFRAWVNSLEGDAHKAGEDAAYLDETSAWAKEYYQPGPKRQERELFSRK